MPKDSDERYTARLHGPRVSRGRVVDYTDDYGQTFPATVIRVVDEDGDRVNLMVLRDVEPTGAFNNFGVRFDQERGKDTWRWPERVPQHIPSAPTF